MNRFITLILSASLFACGGVGDDDGGTKGGPSGAELRTCQGDFIYDDVADLLRDEGSGALNATPSIVDGEDGPSEILIDISECQHITGRVQVWNSTTLENLSILSELVSVGGSLDIRYNEALTSLRGLENLKQIGGELNIGSNPVLQNIDAIGNLEQAGNIVIIRNNALKNVQLWTKPMKTTQGGISFHSNDSLEKISLGQLTSLAGGLNFFNNDSLEHIQVSDSLTTMASSFSINGNSQLVSVEGFSALESIGGRLAVYDNSSLASISDSAFAPLKEIGEDLIFENNPALLQLPQFAHLRSISGQLVVKNNPQLSELNSFKSLESVGGLLEVGDNASLSAINTLTELNSASDIAFLNLPELQKLPTLDKLERISDLYITGNTKLVDLTGLDSLEYVFGSVVLANELESLNGLGALERVGKGLAILEPDLENLDGLWALSPVGRLVLNIPTKWVRAEDQQAFADRLDIEVQVGTPLYYGKEDICIGTLSNQGDDDGLTTRIYPELANFAHCKVITGSLEIFAQSRGVWDQPYLSPLNDLVEVWGDLDIAMDIYEELDAPADGFPALKWIGGDLRFAGTLSKFNFVPQLERLDGAMHFEFVDDWSAVPSFEHLKP